MKLTVILPVTGSVEEFRQESERQLRDLLHPDTELEFVGIDRGFPAIESDLHSVFNGAEIILAAKAAYERGSDGIMIDCFDDPAVSACRELLPIPVLGGYQASVSMARLLTDRFAIITTDQAGVLSEERKAGAFGLKPTVICPVDMGVLALRNDHSELLGRLQEACVDLWNTHQTSAMMAKLEELGVKSPLVDFYRKHIGFDYNGVPMGCGLEDEQSGKLTLNAGVLRMSGKEVTLTLDIRNPVTFGREDVEQPILRACEPNGIRCACTESMDSIYMDKNGKVVRAMVDVYESVTGDTSGPIVIGGGTYARAMPGIVAFGPMQPGRECTEHQANEYILLEDLFAAKEIYRQTIEKLANLD